MIDDCEQNINMNPGVSVNRPRYTVELFHIIIMIVWYNWAIRPLNDELIWLTNSVVPTIGIDGFIRSLFFINMTRGRVINSASFVELKVKAKDVYRDFIDKTQLFYMGKHRIRLTSAGGVLHPVDHFVKQLYERYFPKQSAEAMSTYQRTNPTLQLRLDHLEKYAEPFIKTVPVEELKEQVDIFIDEVASHSTFHVLASSVYDMVTEQKFDDIQIDGSSASGYPFRQGSKKAEDRIEATNVAMSLMRDECQFRDYINDHVWYTTGRARIQKAGAEPASRIIIYAGYTYLLIAMLAIQPWCRFMNRTFDWCGIGFSWMHGGAGKLATYMKADKGYAPIGFRYVSLDVSGWDTKLHHDIMMLLHRFYHGLLIKIGVPSAYRKMLETIIISMVEASVLMPLGHCFKLIQGMKSGWAATGNDNTLLHEMIFRCIMRRLGYMLHILYGDDNLMLVPDAITDDMLVAEYTRFGLKIKIIHSSRYLGDVDFLSKHIHFKDGYYYVFRASVETHARILMPEEMDPRRRDRPDPVIAAERILGHLLDNPFNEDVRNVCYELLGKIKRDYGVEYIEVHDRMRKFHPWRFFDLDKIPRKFPTVPNKTFIEELYGVPIPSHLRINWPKLPEHVVCDRLARQTDSNLFDAASEFSNDVGYKASQLAGKQFKRLVRKISPYSQPVNCYGFHAARFEFAVKFFGIRFDSMLDLGSHPGACASSATKYCKHVTCVSVKPRKDVRDFCPYVVRDAGVVCVQADADFYVPTRVYDLQHDDVDLIGARSRKQDLEIGLGMIRRAFANVTMVDQALITIKEVNWEIKDELYGLYSKFGFINFVKPLFSNPWKCEFMVYVKSSKAPLMRRSAFINMLNAFLNSLSREVFEWNEVIMRAITDFGGVNSVESYPFQTSSFEKEWIMPWSDRKLSDVVGFRDAG